MPDESPVESRFRIGAVSRLTGVPADTLRVWERRYTVVSPLRTDGGNRLYSQEDIDRLVLIKRLVDVGHAIGTVANLSLKQLKERADSAHVGMGAVARHRIDGPARVVVAGPTLPLRLQGDMESEQGSLRVAGSYLDLSDYEAEAAELHADVLVWEVPTLRPDTASECRRLQRLGQIDKAVVVYGFGNSQWVKNLEIQGVVAMRFPVTWDEIRRACGSESNSPPSPSSDPKDLRALVNEAPPERLFNDRQLAKIAAASSTIRCECPHHLADLVISMARFEAYSQECENMGQDDAVLHAYLHLTTAKARTILEEALGRLIEIEGIEVD